MCVRYAKPRTPPIQPKSPGESGPPISSMLLLEQLATRVVDHWDRGDLAASVRALSGHLKELRENRIQHAASIAFARDHYAMPSDDEIEIDDTPLTSASHEGVWISAWLWVDHDQVPDASAPAQGG